MRVTKAQAKRIGDRLKVDWNRIDLEQLRMGIATESEHANVVGRSMIKWAQIALVHLKEIPDYYTRLKRMERR